jgi:hypothetical protein
MAEARQALDAYRGEAMLYTAISLDNELHLMLLRVSCLRPWFLKAPPTVPPHPYKLHQNPSQQRLKND